jgi:aspartyl-tRNA(Asn)/glutamyl-tRNA(Gln) amidotransferase subunit A
MTLGLPKEYFIDGISSEIAQAVKDACEVYASLGAKVEEISLPHTKYAVPTYYIIAPAEASANLARYDGIRYGKRTANPKDLNALYEETRSKGLGPEVTLRIIMGTYVLSSGYYDDYYIRAQKTRTLIKQDFDQAFEKVDAIIAPATPTAAFPLGDKSEDPIRMYLNDVFTIPTSLAGLPALSLPCGFTNGDLPIGLQLIGKSLDETTLLQVAHAYEQATPWHKRKPCL